MDITGLIRRYPTQRPLTEEEMKYQLKQRQRINVDPQYELSVIKLNSTYLEVVDKWFGWKGMLSSIMLIVITMFAACYSGLVHVALNRTSGAANQDVFVLSVTAVMLLPFLGFAIWMLRRESFAYTHYPMRFNRIQRTVHVFRTNGTVLTVPWDDIFFTLGHLPQWNEWEVRGHVLEPNGKTVRETFALGHVDSLGRATLELAPEQARTDDFVRAHWEFIRRYMEDGPAAVADKVRFCMPVDGRRERPAVGFERVFANVAGFSVPAYCLMMPVCMLVGFVRIFAMRFSKVPRWPLEIEATCSIGANDMYAIEATADGNLVAANSLSSRPT